MTMAFQELVDLASERLGGAVVAANDEFFAAKENLIKPGAPEWREGVYTDRGKWMDGWETRRRRDDGVYDWCIVRLGAPGIIRGVDVETTHFTGNFPESFAIDACDAHGMIAEDDLAGLAWREILPRTPLTGNARHPVAVAGAPSATHLRLRIFPDGGVARLRVYGEVVADWTRLARRGDVDLAAVEHGGLVVACSDMFFGSRHNLIMPGDATHMGDGWETRRRRGPGHDWTIVRLGAAGTIRRIEIDTRHFKGNAPGACSLEALRLAGDSALAQGGAARLAGDAALAQGGAARLAGDAAFAQGGAARLAGDAALAQGGAARLAGDAALAQGGAARLAGDGALAQGGAARLAGDAPLAQSGAWTGADWRDLLPRTPLQPHARHVFEDEVVAIGPVSYVRFNIYPDGGVGRLRLFGRPEGRT
jgi:allantoicase